MPVHENSIEALRSMSEEMRSRTKREVLDAIRKLGQATDKEVATYLGWSINRVTPRRGELEALGKVYCVGKFKRGGRVPENVWAVSKQETQLQIKLPF